MILNVHPYKHGVFSIQNIKNKTLRTNHKSVKKSNVSIFCDQSAVYLLTAVSELSDSLNFFPRVYIRSSTVSNTVITLNTSCTLLKRPAMSQGSQGNEKIAVVKMKIENQ